MPRSFICLSAALAAATVVIAFQPAQAATVPSQVRVAVSPGASDPAWKTAGVKFEKQVECKVIKPTSATPARPLAGDIISTGKAKAPLFNPGIPNPNGTYSAGATNGDNTIFVPLDLSVDPNSFIGCSATILANGIDVTADSRAGLVYATMIKIGGTGPLQVQPSLDKTKLSALTAKLPKRGSFELVFQYYPAGGPSGLLNVFDLDAGMSVPIGANETSGDIGYNFSPMDGPSATFSARNGAMFSNAKRVPGIPAVPAPEPPLTLCKSEQLVLAILTMYPNSKPEFLCMKTSQGRYAAVQYRGLSKDSAPDPNKPGTPIVTVRAKFSYVVWPN